MIRKSLCNLTVITLFKKIPYNINKHNNKKLGIKNPEASASGKKTKNQLTFKAFGYLIPIDNFHKSINILRTPVLIL